MRQKMGSMKVAELIFIVLMWLQGCNSALNCSSPTPSALFRELERNLFPENLVRPVENLSSPIVVTLDITVVGILGVDEKAQTLTSVLWQVLEWDIHGLSWDEQKCGAKRVSVPREKLWLPDILISEMMGSREAPETTPYLYLYNTGRVFDDQPIDVVSSCMMHIYTFPFDIQNCSLTFGSYLHFSEDIIMIQGSSTEDILQESRHVMVTNGEWELANISVAKTTLALGNGDYSEIKFFVILRRRPTLYVVNLLIPSCFLITVDLFSFLLPPQSVDRSSFKMTLILGYTVFLLIMNDLLPVTGDTTPLINIFFSISLALMVASLLETIFITNIQFSSSQYSAVPKWLSILVLRYLAVLVCLPPPKKSNRVTVCIDPTRREPPINSSITHISLSQNLPEYTAKEKPYPATLGPHLPPPPPPPIAPDPSEPAVDLLKKLSRDLAAIRAQMNKHFEGSQTSQEWLTIGLVVDRLLFGLYIVFILASFITILCIWIWNNSSVA